MVTFITGQIIEQINNHRAWKIMGPAPSDPLSGSRRWNVELIDPGVHDDGRRRIGEITRVSETWAMTNCIDVTMLIEPPIGNGAQTVAFQIMDGVVAQEVLTTAADAIAFFSTHFTANEGNGIGMWWGWNPGSNGPTDPTDEEPPDMTVTMINGALVWAEGS